ncbi:probable pectinesterase 66 [Salvia splendens]|uniref:probable pectinesterase 66 n=1 Tax=Salvia splendens TaxID=180675 RepID=UPI001C27DF11|nr:probable pectinesterase 66 [Salvia splendens]
MRLELSISRILQWNPHKGEHETIFADMLLTHLKRKLGKTPRDTDSSTFDSATFEFLVGIIFILRIIFVEPSNYSLGSREIPAREAVTETIPGSKSILCNHSFLGYHKTLYYDDQQYCINGHINGVADLMFWSGQSAYGDVAISEDIGAQQSNYFVGSIIAHENDDLNVESCFIFTSCIAL